MELLFYNSEFEHAVREQLQVFDRPITDADALLITDLDLIDPFDDKDIETLSKFKNLHSLGLEMRNQDSTFWSCFPKLEELYWVTWNGPVDFSVFSAMKNLTRLTVSGGDFSSIAFENLEALIPLKKLNYLELHEFGPVDLLPLESMKQLKSLAVRYSHEVKNIAVIGTMTQLEFLELDDLLLENFDFLNTLPDSVELEICGVRVSTYKAVNVEKWKRFVKCDICEISAEDSPERYLDLSELNTPQGYPR